MADGMREKTTNVGGVIKRIWYAMTGATQGAQLLSLDDAGNLEGKLLNPVINGTATGTAITTTGEANKLVKTNSSGCVFLSRGKDLFFGDESTINAGAGVYGKVGAVNSQGLFTVPHIIFGTTGNDDKGYISFVNNGAERFNINYDGSVKANNLSGTGNRAVYSDASGNLTNTSSDERVKKNIKNLADTMNVLEVLKNIRGITYNWNNSIEGYENAGEQEEIGVIAQEIEQYIPQIVGENQTGYKSVDYAKLVAFLIETNKALLERVETLESKVV